MKVFYLLLFTTVAVSGRKLTDEEYFSLPKLNYLDDYEKCLSQKNGLYCMGIFHLTPEAQPHAMYDLLKEYSKVTTKFNRTLIHRGYCVSARCPSAERNASLRFERCAAQWGRERALRTTLHTLHYCRTHQDTQIVHRPDIWQRSFYYTIYIILTLNTIGTLYDITAGSSNSPNFLRFWSVRSNWKRLTAIHEHSDPRISALSPIHGSRILTLILIPFMHYAGVSFTTFLYNPHNLEELIERPYAVISMSSTSANQALIALSSFLSCFYLLLFSEKKPLSFKILPISILERIFRIAPVYYLTLFYAVTWWPLANDGPLWPIYVTSQNETCRRKFLYQILFINNLVGTNEHCILPTWFLAANMHMFIAAVVLTIWIVRQRRHVLPILVSLYLAMTILIGVVSYYKNWKGVLHEFSAENIRTVFINQNLFSMQYTGSWPALSSCLLGVIFAYLQYRNTIHGFNAARFKWLAVFQYISIPLLLMWLYMGNYIKEYTSPIFIALYVTIERPICSIIFGLKFYAVINIDGPLRSFWGWRGFQPLARLNLSTMLMSWILNISYIAGKMQPLSISLSDIMIESSGIILMSFLLAVPLTVLVEMPIGRFLSDLLAKSIVPLKSE